MSVIASVNTKPVKSASNPLSFAAQAAEPLKANDKFQ
jgi:hypothetical protein